MEGGERAKGGPGFVVYNKPRVIEFGCMKGVLGRDESALSV